MIDIHITHNPFLVHTSFEVDGQAPGENSQFSEYTTQRLQLWIEGFFDSVSEIFNGEKNFNISFRGVESDCVDMQQAVKEANEAGMQIQLTCETVEGPETRLDKVSQMIAGAKKNPLFKDYFESNSNLKDKISQTLDKDFDVYVIATMSSGKSTLINAMMGCPLLPALNEATTATIATIYDNDHEVAGEFQVSCLDSNNKTLFEETLNIIDGGFKSTAYQKMAEWNKSEEVTNIRIFGNIPSFTERDNVRLVLTDTPGPNNSQNEAHALTTMRFIKDSDRNPLIIYVLNAGQMGTDDDKRLLKEIASVISKGGKQNKDRFIFVLNKVDEFDAAKGESVSEIIEKIKAYLKSNDIDNPLVYPVSARLALLSRINKINPDILTDDEKFFLEYLKMKFKDESKDLVQYMPLTSKQKETLASKDLDVALYRSGLPALEVAIDDYINRYSLPNRVTRAYQGLSQLIEQSTDTAEIQKALEVNEEELAEISKALLYLEAKCQKGFETDGYIASLTSKKSKLPNETMDEFNMQLAEIDQFLASLNSEFEGEGSKEDAEYKIDQLESTVRNKYNSMLVDLDKAINESQKKIRDELSQAYNDYLIALFSDVDELDMPILKGIKRQVLSFEYDLDDSEVIVKEKTIKTGTVFDIKWYNPFTWLRTKDVFGVQKEEIVDLEKIWQARERKIRSNLKQLVQSARKQAEKNQQRIVGNYSSFMKQQFEKRFWALLADLHYKADNKKQREAAIEQAKSDIREINHLNNELSSLMKV